MLWEPDRVLTIPAHKFVDVPQKGIIPIGFFLQWDGAHMLGSAKALPLAGTNLLGVGLQRG